MRKWWNGLSWADKYTIGFGLSFGGFFVVLIVILLWQIARAS